MKRKLQIGFSFLSFLLYITILHTKYTKLHTPFLRCKILQQCKYENKINNNDNFLNILQNETFVLFSLHFVHIINLDMHACVLPFLALLFYSLAQCINLLKLT